MKILIKLLFILFSIMLYYQNNVDNMDILFPTLLISILSFSYELYNKKSLYFILSLSILALDKNSIYFIPIFLYDLEDNSLYSHLSKIFLFFIITKPIVLLLSFTLILYKRKLNFIKNLTRDNYDLTSKLIDNKKAFEDEKRLLSQNNESYIEEIINEEQNRIARDIHDTAGHLISSSIIQLGAIQALNKQENLDMPIEKLNKTLSSIMDNTRKSIHSLSDSGFDLKYKIENLIENYEYCKVSLFYQIFSNISFKISYNFYMIIRESLTNTAKHSNGDLVKISLYEKEDNIFLTIDDNGILEKRIHFGVGLTGMMDRIESLGGTINISTLKKFKIFISIKRSI